MRTVVGNIVVPLADVKLGHVEASWLYFSAGLVFWILLFTIVLNRIIFHHRIAALLLATAIVAAVAVRTAGALLSGRLFAPG